MRHFKYSAFFCLLWGLVPATGFSAVIEQWASSVINFSSEWSSTSWSAEQTLGEPNTFLYGDIPTAWSPMEPNGSIEYITLGFSTPVFATGATIRETQGNGFVSQVDVLDVNSVLNTVWAGTDTSLPGSPVNFSINWAMTDFLVTGLKIYINTDHDLFTWEQIDAVQLRGSTVFEAPAASTAALMLAVVPAFLWRIRKRRNCKVIYKT